MYVICQYFAHPNAARAAEYEYCLRDHIRNGHQLILFEEQPAPEDIRRGAAKCVTYPQRITFEFVFKWANDNLPQGAVVALANLDIFLRFKGEDAEAYMGRYPLHMMCLSRMEYRPDRGEAVADAVLEENRYWSCQDVWVFRVPVPPISRADFPVGNCPGCDNAIAFRAAEAGLIPVNVADSFPVWHYDTKPKELEARMNYDKKTELLRPERRGRLFMPRIKEGELMDAQKYLTLARNAASATLEQQGYGLGSDTKWTAYLACLTGVRCVQRWDLLYLFLCLAINNATFLSNP